ncbi:MAG: DUF1194 domain-containing protein [Pseudomonadota bacterium]
MHRTSLCRFALVAVIALGGLSLVTAPRPAEGAPLCRLALVLALDVSASVDETEYDLLRRGTAAALDSPQVREAIKALGGVYLSVFEWSGRSKQRIIVPWVALENGQAIAGAAGQIAVHPRSTSEYPTALGAALGYAHGLLGDGPAFCERQVVDMAGDGENNHGFGPGSAYRAFDYRAITVNGLVVGDPDGEVATYYAEEVLNGPDSFLEVARGYEDFEETMRRKLLREIGVLSLSALE